MSPQKDEAVVVRLTEYSETSQIVTLYSAGHGQLRLIAKGARRGTKKRPAVGLDLLERGEVGFLPPHGDAQLGTLTEWVQTEPFAGMRREAVRLYAGLYAAELVAGLTEEGDPHTGLFEALVGALGALAGDGPAGPVVPAFQSALLQAIGYAPNLEQCVGCQRRAADDGLLFFSAGAGGLVCRDCEMHYVEKRRIPGGLLKRAARAQDARAWFELLDYHLTHIAGRRFKTAEPLRALLA